MERTCGSEHLQEDQLVLERNMAGVGERGLQFILKVSDLDD